MELSPGILKSIDSAFHQLYNQPYIGYVVKYRGKLMYNGKKLMLFANKGTAKTFVLSFIRLLFYQGWYWDKYKDNIKRDTGYEVDYSGTMDLLLQSPGYAQIDFPANKKIMKDIQNELFKQKIITIHEVSFPTGPDESKDIPLMQSHRSVVMDWWNNSKSVDFKNSQVPYFYKGRTPESLTGREIETIYNFFHE